MVQAPLVQALAACGRLQAMAQLPQWLASVLVFTSQPLPALPSQLAKPGLQVIWQAEFTHAGVPLLLEQARPQPPQLAALVAVLTSQPFCGLPSQSANPALHEEMVHRPAVHCGV